MQTRINNNETNFTIVFPNRVYEISGEPLTGGLKFNFTSLLLKNDNNIPGAKIPIQINFIGYKTLPSSEITSISTGDIPTTNMTCNYNPASPDFLSIVNNYSDFPQLHSNYKDDFNVWHHHDFLEIIAQVEDEQYWKSVNVMGLYIRGENPEYDPYHPFFDKQLGTYGIHIRHARDFFVDNNVIDNIYGGAIKLRSGQEDINTENKSLPSTIERNIITNCWGNNPRTSCDCSIGNCTNDVYGCGYDNYGDGIECDALDKALIQYNFIKNDLTVTKQLSRAGITLQWASGCTVQYNFVHGYDRNFHIEITRYKSHTLKYNRSTGSLLSLWDGEEDPEGYDFYTPPNIMYNYFSTTGMQAPNQSGTFGFDWNPVTEKFEDINSVEMIKYVLSPLPIENPNGLKPILSVKYPFITTTNGLSTAEILNNLNFRNNLIEINESDYAGWYRDYGLSSNSSRVTSIFSGSTNVKEVVFKCNTVKVINSHGDFLALNQSGTFHTVSGNTFDGNFRNSGSANQHICFPSSPTSTILSCNDFSNVSPANSQNNYDVNPCSPVTDNCANHQHLLLAPPLVTNISCGDIASGSNDGSIFFD
ncbi:MAG: hypothetical protein JNJ58_02095, partial [Chitinophagaceae bacterium]|nr:hypothetical protein [Chitinophagaceae bacterium]